MTNTMVSLRLAILWVIVGLPSFAILCIFAAYSTLPPPETGVRGFNLGLLLAAVVGFGYAVSRTVYTIRIQRAIARLEGSRGIGPNQADARG